MDTVALDTSVSVPHLMKNAEHHRAVSDRLRDLDCRLTHQSLAETYAVLTRLPGDARLTPQDAATLIDESFGKPALLAPSDAGTIHDVLSQAGISGGATYDGVTALAARKHRLRLVTRDARAIATYRALGVDLEVLG